MDKVLEIIDLPDHNQVQLCMNRDGQRRTAPPVPFADPANEEQYQEIAWYFQNSLDDPSEVSKSRAEGVESSLRDLGRRLFETIFLGNDESRSCYADACADGLSDYQLIICSPNSSFLALPWELLNEPDGGYLCHRVASVARRNGDGALPHTNFSLTIQQLNVLLVSPFPHVTEYSASSDEILAGAPSEYVEIAGSEHQNKRGSGSLAIETLEVLDSINVAVELDYLRPPTFTALADHLASRSAHYHLVHFDSITLSSSGALLFKAEDSAGDQIDATRVAELLAAARVPLALINAGMTDPLGLPNHWQNWAAVGASLAAGGVPQVISVPFPLAGASRHLFLRPVYQAIAQGGDLPRAVAQARKALRDDPLRPAISGMASICDWVGPSVYQSQAYTPTPIAEEQTPSLSQPQSLPTETTERTDLLPQGGPYGLVGRRSELFHLERLFEIGPVVLLCGDTGIGKTELALGLGRWLHNTRSRTGGVFYTSFDLGAGLERVIHEAGTSVAGLEFADMTASEQRRWLLEYLNNPPFAANLGRTRACRRVSNPECGFAGRRGMFGTERLLTGGGVRRSELDIANKPPQIRSLALPPHIMSECSMGWTATMPWNWVARYWRRLGFWNPCRTEASNHDRKRLLGASGISGGTPAGPANHSLAT